MSVTPQAPRESRQVRLASISAACGIAMACGWSGCGSAQPRPDDHAAWSPQAATTPPTATTPLAAPLQPFGQAMPVSAFVIDLVPIPASPDGSIGPFWMSRTEITWEAFDIFVYRLDEEAGRAKVDAVTRPSKPYLPPDRGFGHEGFPAISLSFKNAQEFCKWLSARTGRKYRLPTEAEWEYAARAGAAKDTPLGAGIDAARPGDSAWIDENADFQPHAVGEKKPNAWGLCDMLGNVQEWAVAVDGGGVCKGGSYRTRAADLSIAWRAPADDAWNSSDPQVPKSKWWLADGPFVGFRIVCDAPGVK